MAATKTLIRARTYWTIARYLRLPDDGKLYEVLGGELIRRAKPNLRHQEIVANVGFAMDTFVREKKMGQVIALPVDVVLDNDLVEPDILYVSEARKRIVGEARITGAPDLVVEVLSLSTSARDLRYKWDLYARRGVREYWVVNPEAETVEVLTLSKKAYKRHVLAEKEGAITSKVLEGFSVPAKDIFAE